MTPIKPHGNHSILYIIATPGASKDRIGEIVSAPDQQPCIKIYVTAIAENGAANKAIINFLSKKLEIPKSLFRILSGEISRRKSILVQVTEDDLKRALKYTTGSLF